MPKLYTLHIGFDDTDSPKGMCTTFLAYKIVEYLKREKTEFIDFPHLIRFNPNIPWKTRGNGAVALKIKTKNPTKIKTKIKNFVSKYSDIKNGANPGLIFFEHQEIPEDFKKFSQKALWKLIHRKDAKKFVKRNNIEYFYKGNGQGLVGAIGAIGYEFSDHTFELLSYRKKSMLGKERLISKESVKDMQKKTGTSTFNSFDVKKNRVLIAPHGPDPVFYGVRGEDIGSLLYAQSILKIDESPYGYMIFKSNQGTGDHLRNNLDVKNLDPHSSGIVVGTVSDSPKIIKGGHVLFSILSDKTKINCAVYKKTGITNNAKNLIIGDKIKVGGGIRRASKNFPRTLNVEFIEIKTLTQSHKEENPICFNCKKKMKSKGKGQGFQCSKCGMKLQGKVKSFISRSVEKTLYIPDVAAHRHLTRPFSRLDKKNIRSHFSNKTKWFLKFKN